MADQKKNPQSNQKKQGGQQQGSRNRNQGSGMDDTLRTQQNRDENQPGQQGQRSRVDDAESMRDEEQIGQGTRREPTHTAHDRSVSSERRNVSGTDRESLDTEGIESETDIADEDLDSER